MIGNISSAISGLSVSQKKVDAASQNIANLNTDGYKRVDLEVREGTPAGVRATIRQDPTPGPLVPEPTGDGERLVEKSNVDLVQEVTALDLGKFSYEANLKTLKTQDEMLGSLLDLFR